MSRPSVCDIIIHRIILFFCFAYFLFVSHFFPFYFLHSPSQCFSFYLWLIDFLHHSLYRSSLNPVELVFPPSLPSILQSTCDTLRSHSDSLGFTPNMLPRHPTLGNFEEFACWRHKAGVWGTSGDLTANCETICVFNRKSLSERSKIVQFNNAWIEIEYYHQKNKESTSKTELRFNHHVKGISVNFVHVWFWFVFLSAPAEDEHKFQTVTKKHHFVEEMMSML